MDTREQLVVAKYLRPGPLSYGVGIGAAAVGLGLGVLLFCWGLSWVRPGGTRSAEVAGASMTVGHASSKPGQPSPVIRTEVTKFQSVEHETGEVATAWQFADGRGGVPIRQYCYFVANVPGTKHKSDQTEIAIDGKYLPDLDASSVPDLKGAEAKCKWWTKEQAEILSQD
jgi:hypothetical protein